MPLVTAFAPATVAVVAAGFGEAAVAAGEEVAEEVAGDPGAVAVGGVDGEATGAALVAGDV